MSPLFIIHFGISLCMIVFGINQLKSPHNWLGYLPPWLVKMGPLKPETTMRMHAVGNIVIGLFLLISTYPFFPHIATWVAFLWWLSILPFAFRYNWAIGMRDLAITLTLLALILI